MSDEHGGRRRGWLIFLGIALLLVGGLVGIWVVWSIGANNRLEKEVQALKAAGEPIEPADFEPTGVPDADNAALDLRDAFKAIDQKSEVYKAWGKLDVALPLTQQEVDAMRAAVDANAEALRLLESAATRKQVDWQIPIRSPVINTLLPQLNEVRELANLARARATLRFHDGDHAGALRDLERIVFLARTLDRQPLLISHLVSVGCIAVATHGAEEMAPELKVGAAPGAASPEQVSAFMAMLLDDRSQREGQIRGFQGERMMQLDVARSVASGKLNLASLGAPGGGGAPGAATALMGTALRPMARDDGLLMIRHTTRYIDAIRNADDWPAFQKVAPVIPPQVARASVRHLLARMMMPSLDNAVKTDFRTRAERRMVAIALAARWYAAEHDGKLPGTLDDLVPKYLPSAPLDPFRSGDQPLKYVADEARPIVYSAADDGVDDGGSEASSTKRKALSKWMKRDAVTHLKRQPRPKPDNADDADDVVMDPAPATSPATSPTTAPLTP